VSELPVFIAGLIVGLVLGLGIARLRKTTTLGAITMSPPASRASTGVAATTTDEAKPAIPGRQGLLTRLASDLAGMEDDERHVVISEQTSIRIMPDGLTITIDGQTYHGLAAVPADRRDEIRAYLRQMPESIKDPELRAMVEQDLRDAGAV
jgi:hypothetical protein